MKGGPGRTERQLDCGRGADELVGGGGHRVTDSEDTRDRAQSAQLIGQAADRALAYGTNSTIRRAWKMVDRL